MRFGVFLVLVLAAGCARDALTECVSARQPCEGGGGAQGADFGEFNDCCSGSCQSWTSLSTGELIDGCEPSETGVLCRDDSDCKTNSCVDNKCAQRCREPAERCGPADHADPDLASDIEYEPGDCCDGSSCVNQACCGNTGTTCTDGAQCCTGDCSGGTCSCVDLDGACGPAKSCCDGMSCGGEGCCKDTGEACSELSDCCVSVTSGFASCDAGTCAARQAPDPNSLWLLTAVSGTIAQRDRNDQPWEDAFAGEPDPFVCVTIGMEICTRPQETREPLWKFAFPVATAQQLLGGLDVRYEEDDTLSGNELICADRIQLTAADFTARRFKYECSHGSVEFTLEARRHRQ